MNKKTAESSAGCNNCIKTADLIKRSADFLRGIDYWRMRIIIRRYSKQFLCGRVLCKNYYVFPTSAVQIDLMA